MQRTSSNEDKVHKWQLLNDNHTTTYPSQAAVGKAVYVLTSSSRHRASVDSGMVADATG